MQLSKNSLTTNEFLFFKYIQAEGFLNFFDQDFILMKKIAVTSHSKKFGNTTESNNTSKLK